MQPHAGEGIGHVDKGEQNAGEENAHHDDHKQEAGAAAGVVPGLLADVLHRQRLAPLITEDGLVLGAVVLEHPVDILHTGAEDQIPHKDDDTHHALQQVAPPHGQREKVGHAAGQGGGQQEKQDH